MQTSPELRRAAVEQLQYKFSVSERRACRVLDQPRSTQRYMGQPKDGDSRQTEKVLDYVHR